MSQVKEGVGVPFFGVVWSCRRPCGEPKALGTTAAAFGSASLSAVEGLLGDALEEVGVVLGELAGFEGDVGDGPVEEESVPDEGLGILSAAVEVEAVAADAPVGGEEWLFGGAFGEGVAHYAYKFELKEECLYGGEPERRIQGILA